LIAVILICAKLACCRDEGKQEVLDG